MKYSIFSILVVILLVSSCKTAKYPDLEDGLYADIETTLGDMLLELEHEKTPVTVANFVTLAEGNSPFVTDSLKDKPYYDGLTFHRVMKDFMIQGGDPTGTGRGNPGYRFADEFNDSLRHSGKGVLSMANSGPNTNGSQFFITHKATPWLDDRHTVFGKLISGEDVLDSIAGVEVDPANNRPLVSVTIKKLNIIRNGKEAKNFDAISIMESYFEEEEEREAAREKMKADIVISLSVQSDSVERTESGLGILTLTEGSGAQPENGQYVLVNYTGWLLDSGDLFDSNIKDMATLFDKFNPQRDAQGGYQPLPFEYSTESKVIPGFREGLLSMKVGDKKRFFIPSHLGYGEQGAGGGLIPPNADLVFEVEIMDIYQQPDSGGSSE